MDKRIVNRAALALMIPGTILLVTPPFLNFDATGMRLIIDYWEIYATGLSCLAAAFCLYSD